MTMRYSDPEEEKEEAEAEAEMLGNIELLTDDLDLTVIDGLIAQVRAGIEVMTHRERVDLDLIEQARSFRRKLGTYRTKQF